MTPVQQIADTLYESVISFVTGVGTLVQHACCASLDASLLLKVDI
jgi:hypothetical protein